MSLIIHDQLPTISCVLCVVLTIGNQWIRAYLLGRCIDFEIPRLCWVGLSYQNFLVRHGRDRSIPLAMISVSPSSLCLCVDIDTRSIAL